MKHLTPIVLLLFSFVSGLWAQTAPVRVENDGPSMVLFSFQKLGADQERMARKDINSFAEGALNPQLTWSYLAASSLWVQDLDSSSASVMYVAEISPDSTIGTLKCALLSQSFIKSGGYVSVSQVKSLKSANGSVVSIDTSVLKQPPSLIKIDGRFVDWLNVDDQMVFPDNHVPLSVTRSAGGTASVIPVGEAQGWAKAGSDLDSFKIAADSTYLYFEFSSKSSYGNGTSLLLRLWLKDEAGSDNFMTLAIPLGLRAGAVFQLPNDGSPKIVGDFCRGDYMGEARVKLSSIVSLGVTIAPGQLRIGVSSRAGDGSVLEEFYFGSVSLSNQ